MLPEALEEHACVTHPQHSEEDADTLHHGVLSIIAFELQTKRMSSMVNQRSSIPANDLILIQGRKVAKQS